MSSATAQPPGDLLTGLLRDVSRSFYLTLRVLPRSVRPQISLAYLLARTTDTVADTSLLPVPQRLIALQDLRRCILEPGAPAPDFGPFLAPQETSAERTLLARVQKALALLDQTPSEDRLLIRTVLDVIIGGQMLDLERFGHASADEPLALQTLPELDDYTFRVAGCVGEFWTRICLRHVLPPARVNEAFLLENGVLFGQGLQLVNILRDVARDLRQGRCYLPLDGLTRIGLTPRDLLDPGVEDRLRPLYNSLLDRAASRLKAGSDYTLHLPRSCPRIRLACAWPILIGRETLQLLRSMPALNPKHRIRIPRSRVRQILIRSVVRYPFPSIWARDLTPSLG